MADLTPPLFQQFFDSNGDPLAGGKVYTYIAGSSTPTATYTDKSATTPNTNPILLDANGCANVWIGPGAYKFVITDKDDVVLKTIDQVTAPDGVADDGDYSFNVWSLRFSEQFTSTGLMDTLTKIIQPGYSQPLISVSGSSNILREKGDTVSGVTLTAGITKRSDPIAEVRFYRNPSTLLDTQTSGGGIPNGGNSTYNYATPFSDTVTFRAEADDDGTSGGPTTVQATTTYNFVYPYYVGAGSPGLSAASVAALTKRIIQSTANRTETIAASGGNVFYFAYPASYGALTSILDVNNFETIGDWTLRTENITGLDASAQSYHIYEFDNPVTAGSYQYTFKR